MSRQRTGSRVLDVDGEPVRLCGVPLAASPEVDAAVAELVRAVRAHAATQPGKCLADPPVQPGERRSWRRPPCLRETEHQGLHRDHAGREW